MLKLTRRVVPLLVLFSVSFPTLTLEAADAPSAPSAPPVAKQIPKVTEINGHELVDNYFWLRDNKNPDVKAYLDAENAYTEGVMKFTEPIQNNPSGELLTRIKATDRTAP